MLKIYNSLTRQKQEFKTIELNQVKMYTCGVTVYDDCHIGHARSLYIFEVIRRYLKFRGYDVKLVRNITDVDDKIINRANQLKTDWKQLVEKYIQAYYQDMADLGVSKADIEPKATEYIEQMKKYIQVLIDKEYAYVTDSGVYFNVRKFKDYGKLSGQSIDQMQAGSRKEVDETKHDSLDFALWKKAKDGEPFWESPWGKGRPGWHIECSVMSQECFSHKDDDPAILDIHAGGLDLKFPHHENEVTQSEAYSGKKFANFWIHHGLLTINNQKMSKSLGNFITIKDVLKKYPADVLKILYLQAHYASPVDFSWEKMDEAKRAYEHLVVLMGKLKNNVTSNISDVPRTAIKQYKDYFIEAMDDDFNTAQGLAVLFELINYANKAIVLNDKEAMLESAQLLSDINNIFAFTFTTVAAQGLSDEQVESLVQLRVDHKKNKKFKEADDIRAQLTQQGIIIEDTKDKTTWRRKL